MTSNGRQIDSETALYYQELLCRLAEELWERSAFIVLSTLLDRPAVGISGDQYHWPYAKPITESSLVDELVFLMHEDPSWRLDQGVLSLFSDQAAKIVEAFSHAEEEVVLVAYKHETLDDFTYFQAMDWAKERVSWRIMDLAAGHDSQTLRENIEAFGFKSSGRFDETDDD